MNLILRNMEKQYVKYLSILHWWPMALIR